MQWQAAVCQYYGDPEAHLVRDRLSRDLGVPIDSIVLGAGIDELLSLCCRLFVSPGNLPGMRNAPSIHEQVATNFGPVAADYAISPTHANERALEHLVRVVDPKSTDEVLDIATGPGNVALAFAPHVARVVAFDLTPSMLEQTLRTAAKRGISNVETVQGLAENLPFEACSFDVAVVRLAPHHYSDIQLAVDEMARVVRVGGKVAIVDTTVPEDDGLDREINEIETLRDNSHVRNYRPSEWRKMLRQAGLTIIFDQVGRVAEDAKLDFDQWVERIRTPGPQVGELRTRLRNASLELAAAIQLEFVCDRAQFAWEQVTLVALKCR